MLHKNVIEFLYFSYVSNSGAAIGCPQKMGFCQASPCKNGGTCVDGWESFNCICPTGYVSKDCGESKYNSWNIHTIDYL